MMIPSLKNSPLLSRRGLAFLAASQLIATAASAATPTLTIEADKSIHDVSPTLYGLMTEEINHSYDGGLYADLIQNRAFKDDANTPAHWSAVQRGEKSKASIALDLNQPINEALTTCLRLEAENGGGIANDGYWGIPVKPQTTYRASFFAKASGAARGPLSVRIESADGATVFAEAQVPKVSGEWQQYSVTLKTAADAKPSTNNRLIISTNDTGTLWFNLVSLFPPTFNDRPNGNRVDLMQMLAEMKPKFLRLPGGNYLEGSTFDTRFAWKQTLGPLEQRPGHAGCWRYRSSDGMGLLEFMEWCEDLKMEPLLAVFAGYSLRGAHMDPGAGLQQFVDEALDEIEYVTGDANTKWGAQRAKDGHPEPFKLNYIEIGNEDGFDKSGSYEGRFVAFYDAIKAKYPHLKLISTVGGRDGIAKRFTVKKRTPDVLDEHYYRNAWEMESDAAHYDDYDRQGPKIIVVEWATREGSPTTNLNAALGDAAWMTGMECNSDIVIMACYAPLFVNVNPGGMQWKSDLIGYDALNSYGSPSYYAQKMFSQYLGDKVVPVKGENILTQTWQPAAPKDKPAPPPQQVPTLFYVATSDSRTGSIYLKVVNTASAEQSVQIDVKGGRIAPEGTSVVLTSAHPEDTNSIDEPKKIVPVASKSKGFGNRFTHAFPPYSVNVLQLVKQ
jgi:alpha-N-arabinofuranosidase